jgi:hypothetical protein
VAGEAGTAEGNPQAVWDEVQQEREAGDKPPSETTPAPEPEVKETPAPEPTPAPATDPFASLSPELKARLEKVDQLESAIAVLPMLQQSLKTAEGRVAAMQRELDVAKNAAKAVQDAPSSAQINAAKGNTQKWDALKKEFPDWADATEEFVRASIAGVTPAQVPGLAPEEVERIAQKYAGVSPEALTKAVEEAKVEGKHENWLEDINSPDFVKWLPMQTPELQALAHSTKGRDAIKLLDAYKAVQKAPADDVQKARTDKLAAAVTTRPGGSAPTGKTVDTMTPAELWEYERKRATKRGAGLTY